LEKPRDFCRELLSSFSVADHMLTSHGDAGAGRLLRMTTDRLDLLLFRTAGSVDDGKSTLIEPCAGQGLALWFTGLSSAGKSTLSKAVYERLWAKGHKAEI